MSLFVPGPEEALRPVYVALRGTLFTFCSLMFFFYMVGPAIDRTKHLSAYVGAVALSFALHYLSAWGAIVSYRRRQRERGR